MRYAAVPALTMKGPEQTGRARELLVAHRLDDGLRHDRRDEHREVVEERAIGPARA